MERWGECSFGRGKGGGRRRCEGCDDKVRSATLMVHKIIGSWSERGEGKRE